MSCARIGRRFTKQGLIIGLASGTSLFKQAKSSIRTENLDRDDAICLANIRPLTKMKKS